MEKFLHYKSWYYCVYFNGSCFKSNNYYVLMNFCQSGLHLREVSRSRSKAVSASKMDHFVIIANGWKPLTIITKRSVLDVASALDSPLELREVYTPLLLYG